VAGNALARGLIEDIELVMKNEIVKIEILKEQIVKDER
jgi:hypothetical protein